MALLTGYTKANARPCVADGFDAETAMLLDARAVRRRNVVSVAMQWWWTNWTRFAQGRLEK